MKKILLSTAMILALSVSTSIAAPEPTAAVSAASTTVTAAPAAVVKTDTAKAPHKQMMSKEEWLSKIAAKKAKVVAAAVKLEGAEKALVDAALARADRWVTTITAYTEAGTSYGRSAVRAMNELGWAQSVSHHKDPYPTENVTKIMAEFEAIKAKAATLTGDMKAAADTMIANTESVAKDLEANKGSTFMSQLVHGLHKEVWAFKRFMNMAAHKEAAHEAAKTAAPAATTGATPAAAITPVPVPATAEKKK